MKLSKEQYRTLVIALETAENFYGLMGEMTEKNVHAKKADDIKNLTALFLEEAADHDSKDLVEEFEGEKMLNEKVATKIITDLEEYNEYTFWDFLVDQLTQKELHELYPENVAKEMTEEDLENSFYELQEKYKKIIGETGIKHLSINK